MWLHPYGWRELRWSMSWLRPGGKFNLKKLREKKYKALIPKYSCKFGILKWIITKHQGAL